MLGRGRRARLLFEGSGDGERKGRGEEKGVRYSVMLFEDGDLYIILHYYLSI